LHPEYDQGNSHEDSPECFAHVRHSGVVVAPVLYPQRSGVYMS